jgi:hypothetical protein
VKPSFPHEALPFANAAVGGASILEVEGNRLDLKWVCADGLIRDKFTMMKSVSRKTTVKAKKGQAVTLTASFVGNYKWSTGQQKSKSIQIIPIAGKKTYTVSDEFNCLQETFEVIVSR